MVVKHMCIRCETLVPESEIKFVDQLVGHPPNYTCEECWDKYVESGGSGEDWLEKA